MQEKLDFDAEINILEDMEKKITEDRSIEEYAGLIRAVCAWYRENKRILPWRETEDPYHIWVSEIMLQQTRVEAVKPYYRRFLEALPAVRDLAECPEERLLKLWEGLGYYSRVRNMQKAAVQVMERFGGRIPLQKRELLTLSGIGEYTAGAIASIAGGEPVPAADGNVLRVRSRFFADPRDISLQSTKRSVTEEMTAAMEQYFRDSAADLPGQFNQGLMDLGAGVCLPNGNPVCGSCPLSQVCRAHQERRETEFPVKAAAKARRIEERTVLLVGDTEKTAIHRRPPSGLLAGMYEFPNYPGNLTEQEVLDIVEGKGLEVLHIKKIEQAKHVFSHVEWHMQGYEVRIASFSQADGNEPVPEEWILAGKQEIRKEYAVPSAFRTYAEYIQLRIGAAGAEHDSKKA